MEEIFDIYTRDGKYMGTSPKSKCHSDNPEGYHKPVWIWIINSKNEILLQKRASTKKNFPNLWGLSSGGHVHSGETLIDGAIRETEEELGIKTKPDDYKLCREYIDDSAMEIGQLYVAHLDFDISDIQLQTEEVSEARWFPFEEFKKFIYSKEHVPMDEKLTQLIVEMIEENLIVSRDNSKKKVD